MDHDHDKPEYGDEAMKAINAPARVLRIQQAHDLTRIEFQGRRVPLNKTEVMIIIALAKAKTTKYALTTTHLNKLLGGDGQRIHQVFRSKHVARRIGLLESDHGEWCLRINRVEWEPPA